MSDPLSHQNEKTRASFLETLQEESENWEKEGLISARLRAEILGRYEILRETPHPGPAVGSVAPATTTSEFPLYIRVVLALAVLLVGLAVFLLISFNWKELHAAAKLSIVGGVLAAAHCGGIAIRKTGRKNLADALFFFAGIMFGVGIWQIGQIFHLPADYPTGFCLWGIGVFLMAVVLGSTVLHLLAVAVLGGWVIAALTGTLNLQQMFFYGLLPFAAPSLPLFAMIGIAAGLLRKERYSPAMYTILLLFWWALQGVGCGLGLYEAFHVAAVGLICLATASIFRQKNIAHSTLVRLGVLLILGGLIVPSFLTCWDELLYRNGWYLERRISVDQMVFYRFWTFLLPLIDALILCCLFRFGHGKAGWGERIRGNRFITVFSLVLFVLWIGVSFVSTFLFPGESRVFVPMDQLRTDALSLGGMLTVNAMILSLTIWLIQVGLKGNRGDRFWSGVIFFLIWAVIRYVDLFSGVGGMLGAAVIFLSCGLFMLGIVYIWARRGRKGEVSSVVAVESEPAADRLGPLREKCAFLWQSERNILIGVLLIALLQFGVLGAMIANEMQPHLSGTTIRVKTVPVDPRDLFRGDYVILRYKFSSLGSIPGGSLFEEQREQTVFVSMERKGDVWEASGISRTRPKEGVFLRGTLHSFGNEIVYGIESYFVQEGTGKEIEDAMRANRDGVVVELAVAPNGKASIKTVDVNP